MTRHMSRCRFAAAAAFIASFAVSGLAGAQDLAITNVRVIVGNGPVISSGTIIVRAGKIASVSAGPASTQGLRVIDGRGMSALPGYIDAQHDIGDAAGQLADAECFSGCDSF